MKCPKCGYRQGWNKDGYVCRKCKREYVLNPKTSEWNDLRFLATVRRASRNDTYYFTENGFWRATAPAGAMGPAMRFLVALFVCGIGYVLTTSFQNELGALRWLAFLGFVGLSVVVYRANGQRVFSKKSATSALKTWLREGDDLPKLIHHPAVAEPPPQWAEEDIYEYGFENLLLVNRPEIVDYLVLNGFPQASSTVVVTPQGYPEYLLPIVEKALAADNPLDRPRIFLLHDAGVKEGESWKNLLFQVEEVDRERSLHLGLSLAVLDQLKGVRTIFSTSQKKKLPVDALDYLLLSNLLSKSFETGQSFEEILADQRESEFGEDFALSFG